MTAPFNENICNSKTTVVQKNAGKTEFVHTFGLMSHKFSGDATVVWADNRHTKGTTKLLVITQNGLFRADTTEIRVLPTVPSFRPRMTRSCLPACPTLNKSASIGLASASSRKFCPGNRHLDARAKTDCRPLTFFIVDAEKVFDVQKTVSAERLYFANPL